MKYRNPILSSARMTKGPRTGMVPAPQPARSALPGSDLEVPTDPQGYAAQRAAVGAGMPSTVNPQEFATLSQELTGEGRNPQSYVDMRALRGDTWNPGTPMDKGVGGATTGLPPGPSDGEMRFTVSPVEMGGPEFNGGAVNANGIPARGRAVDPGQFTGGVTEAPADPQDAAGAAPASTLTPELQARAEQLRGGFHTDDPSRRGNNVGSAPGRAVLRAGADLAGFGAVTPVQRGVAHAARSLYNSTFGGERDSTRRARASQRSSDEQQAAIQELTNSGASYDDALKSLGLDQDPEWNPAMRRQVRGQGRADPQFAQESGGYAAMRRRVTPG